MVISIASVFAFCVPYQSQSFPCSRLLWSAYFKVQRNCFMRRSEYDILYCRLFNFVKMCSRELVSTNTAGNITETSTCDWSTIAHSTAINFVLCAVSSLTDGPTAHCNIRVNMKYLTAENIPWGCCEKKPNPLISVTTALMECQDTSTAMA